MTKQELLQQITFGESIAELEVERLRNYFIQTEFWRNVRNGTNDIIYGAKGSGKSAIYTSVTNDTNSLFDDDGILIAAGENPTGNTVFSNLKTDPPTSHTEFVRLWKLYFLIISANILEEYGFNDKYAKQIKQILVDSKLVPPQNRLSSFLKLCSDFVRSVTNGIKEVNTTLGVDSTTGQFSGPTFGLVFNEPSKSDFEKGLVPIEYVYELLNQSLSENKNKIWITIDRLDVAFSESEELETNALKALFKAYLDLAPFAHLKLKIFLRDDIWNNLVNEGFREASHITKMQFITWNRDSLLNLIVRRLLDNKLLLDTFNLDKEIVLNSIEEQEKLFYRFFPKQIDVGAKKPTTIEWILSRTKDGNNINTPREIIQLLNYSRKLELRNLENGINELTDDFLISKSTLKAALGEVSKQRILQTLYAEFPKSKQHIELLRSDKAEHTVDTLSKKWSTNNEYETREIIKRLCEIGFFEQKGTSPNTKYKIPFIYRPYLEIIQGSAVSDEEE